MIRKEYYDYYKLFRETKRGKDLTIGAHSPVFKNIRFFESRSWRVVMWNSDPTAYQYTNQRTVALIHAISEFAATAFPKGARHTLIEWLKRCPAVPLP